MTVPDPLTTVQAYLQAQSALTTLLGDTDYVFARELHPDFVSTMPFKCVVISPAGGASLGPGADSYLEAGMLRVDARSYGQTPFEASRVHYAVYEAMKALHRYVEVGQALLHYATVESGPNQARDPETDWPFVHSSYLVFAGEAVLA